jgi:hypothetical protein
VTLVRVPRPGPTPTDDVRGLGALLYAALTSRWPLDTGGAGLPPAPTTSGRLCTPRQLRAGIPADLSNLTMRALYPDQPGGISSATAFADAIRVRTGPPPDLLPFRSGSEPSEPDDERPDRPPRRSTKLVVPVTCLLVFGLLAWLVVSVVTGNGDNPGSKPAAAGQSPKTSASQTHGSSTSPTSGHKAPAHVVSAPKPIKAAQVTSFNPYNQPPGDDNASDVALASDGNPSTSWETDPYSGYPKFGNLKPGSGLMFDMGAAVTIRQIRISTPTPGISLQVLAADSPSEAQNAMTVVGAKSHVGSSVTISSSSKAPHRYWVVWLTELAPASSGQYQGGISEVRFLH